MAAASQPAVPPPTITIFCKGRGCILITNRYCPPASWCVRGCRCCSANKRHWWSLALFSIYRWPRHGESWRARPRPEYALAPARQRGGPPSPTASKMPTGLPPAAQLLRPDPKPPYAAKFPACRSEEHTSELQSRPHLVCRLLLEKK